MILLGDAFGYVALALVVFTATFMLVRKRLLRYTKNLGLLRRLHMYAATLAGLFIVLHVAYFLGYPVTSAVLFGYGSAALAVFVWATGTAFLERLRDSLFYHGAMSLVTRSLLPAATCSCDRLFQRLRSCAPTPYRAAMPPRVSPLRTV